MTLVICLVIGITLAAYLDLVSSQHRAVVRSEVWNSAVPVAEAGVEEALTHLHLQRTNLNANGWLLATNGVTFSNGVAASGVQYYQDRTLKGGGRYLVAISDAPAPTITAQAFVKAPVSEQLIIRTVQVSTAGGPLFARGLVAKGNIEWTGNIASDSFDSQNSAYSTAGRYDATKRKDNGSVGSVGGTFTMGGGLIYGSASIGPTGNFNAQGGTVGDIPWISGGNTGVKPGHFNDDLNLSFPDVQAPFVSGTIPSGGWVTNTTFSTNVQPVTSLFFPLGHSGTVVTNSVTSATYPSGTSHAVATNVTTTSTGTGKGKGKGGGSTIYTTNYTYTEFEYSTNIVTSSSLADYYDMVLDSGDYAVLSIPNGTKALVRGNARLYVTTTIDMQGQSSITIATTGTLNLYANGDAKLAGNGVINSTADATRFSFWGTPNCKDVHLGGNAEFTGTIYAPQAYLHAGGGGNNQYDIVGSAIIDTAKFNGHFLFHYDENLGKNGPRDAFVVTGWSEI
ncbi:MAG: DUF7305 domain-containing protein [Limisphaerales bacterium]